MTGIYKQEVLASFNAVEVRIRLLQGDFAQQFLGAPFGVEVYAIRDIDETDIEEFNSDELTCDTLEEAIQVYDRFVSTKSPDDLYDFSGGQSRDWLV